MLKPDAAFRKDVTNAKGTLEHRHFAVIAGVIADMNGEDFEALQPVIARYFADKLASTNPRFDRARFLKACGV